MTLSRVAVLVLLAGCIASAPAIAQVRLILPATSLDTPRPKKLIDPDTLPNQNSIDILPLPTPLPYLTPTVPFDVTCVHDQLRAAFPTSTVRLGFVGNQLVLTGHAADASEARAILELVHASAAGHRVVSNLYIRRKILLHLLAVEVDRRAASAVGLQTTNGVADRQHVHAALSALYAAHQATAIAVQGIPATEGKTVGFSAPRCQVTLCAASSTDRISLAVTARFSPADRFVLAQALQTVVEMRCDETLVLTSYCPGNERDVVLLVSPEFVDGVK